MKDKITSIFVVFSFCVSSFSVGMHFSTEKQLAYYSLPGAATREPLPGIHPATITFYQSTTKQCGNNKGIGASGEKCFSGSCAVSQSLLDKYYNFGDTLTVLSGDYSGKYVVNDIAGGKKVVDIWMPVSFKKSFCYKSKIK